MYVHIWRERERETEFEDRLEGTESQNSRTDLEGHNSMTDLEGHSSRTDLEGQNSRTGLEGRNSRTDLERQNREQTWRDRLQRTDILYPCCSHVIIYIYTCIGYLGHDVFQNKCFVRY